MVNFATRMGQMYSPRSNATERVRDAAFRGAQKIPGARDYILQMKYKPMPRYVHGAVVPYAGASKDVALGRMFTQPAVENADGDLVMLDDALGSSFALLGLHVDPSSGLSADAAAWCATADADRSRARNDDASASPLRRTAVDEAIVSSPLIARSTASSKCSAGFATDWPIA